MRRWERREGRLVWIDGLWALEIGDRVAGRSSVEEEMARFFFNFVEPGKFEKDNEGIELSGFDEVRAAVMKALPDIAREEIPEDGDYRSLVLLVTDESGQAVYSGTLSFTGIRLQPEPAKR